MPLSGRPAGSDREYPVASYSGEPLGTVANGSRRSIVDSLDAARAAHGAWARTARSEREGALRSIALHIMNRRDYFAELITRESGKPIRATSGEVNRASAVFALAADYVATERGEAVRLSGSDRATVERVPLGVVLGITPFNSPLVQSAHKIAPALAMGNAVLHKPAPVGTLATYELARLVRDEVGEAMVFLPIANEDARGLVVSRRYDALSFTGSVRVGELYARWAAPRRTTLELGSVAAAVVGESADVELAAEECVRGAFDSAGQSCISQQRVLVHHSLMARFTGAVGERTAAVAHGDPLDPNTVVGPMVSEDAARRVERLIDRTVARGGRVLVGGKRSGRQMLPTAMVVPDGRNPLSRREAFGPVLVLQPFNDPQDAIAEVHAVPLGLSHAIFARDLIEVSIYVGGIQAGQLVINGHTRYRADNLPFGGIRRSGIGTEGIPAAMEAFSRPKTVIWRS